MHVPSFTPPTELTDSRRITPSRESYEANPADPFALDLKRLFDAPDSSSGHWAKGAGRMEWIDHSIAAPAAPGAAAIAQSVATSAPSARAPEVRAAGFLPPKADTPEAWKAEWAASADLQSEFVSAERYVNYQQGVKAGRIGPGVGGRTVSSGGTVSMLNRPKR